MMETLFKLRKHFKGSQIWIVHTSTFKTFWSLTKVWPVQIEVGEVNSTQKPRSSRLNSTDSDAELDQLNLTRRA